MRKGPSIIAACIIILAVVAFFVTSVPLQAEEKAMKLRISSMWPPQHPLTKTFEQWGKDIEKVTAKQVQKIGEKLFLNSPHLTVVVS